MKKTLVIGLGNPILGDDGVGWKVAEQVQKRLEGDGYPETPVHCSGSQSNRDLPAAEVDFAALGGLSLMERMIGYQRAILVDAIETGQRPPGSVRVFPLEALTSPREGHSASAHDTSLITALTAARDMGITVPETINVVAIEAENVNTFSEELTPAVAGAVPLATRTILNLLKLEET